MKHNSDIKARLAAMWLVEPAAGGEGPAAGPQHHGTAGVATKKGGGRSWQGRTLVHCQADSPYSPQSEPSRCAIVANQNRYSATKLKLMHFAASVGC